MTFRSSALIRGEVVEGDFTVEQKRMSGLRHDVRLRDGGVCRWPGCGHRRFLVLVKIGTAPSLTAEHILVCQNHKFGGHSFETGNLDARPLTEAGANGPLVFFNDDVEVGREPGDGRTLCDYGSGDAAATV